MTRQLVAIVLTTTLMSAPAAHALVEAQGSEPPGRRYVDAANGVSLEQAVARALEQEPSLRAARGEIEAARGRRLQASLRPNPSLSLERREEPAGTDNQTIVGLQWPLDLFRRGARVSAAEHEMTAVEHAVADRERLLAAEVRTRYGDVLEAVREVDTLDELLDAVRQQHALTRARVEEGATPALERDLLNVELRRLESDRLLLAGRTEAALFELKRLLGVPAGAALAVRDTLTEVVRRDPSAAPAHASSALPRRPDVMEAAARIGLAEARVGRARAEGRFDVSLFAGYMRMDAGFPQRGFAPDASLQRIRGVFHNVAAGATITVPLFDRNQGEVAAAQAEQAAAVSSHEAARLTADAEVAAARTREAYARQAVTVSAEAQALARQNLAVVRQSYELGRLTIFDVLAEQRRYLAVERDYTAALKAAYDARTALTRALGDAR